MFRLQSILTTPLDLPLDREVLSHGKRDDEALYDLFEHDTGGTFASKLEEHSHLPQEEMNALLKQDGYAPILKEANDHQPFPEYPHWQFRKSCPRWMLYRQWVQAVATYWEKQVKEGIKRMEQAGIFSSEIHHHSKLRTLTLESILLIMQVQQSSYDAIIWALQQEHEALDLGSKAIYTELIQGLREFQIAYEEPLEREKEERTQKQWPSPT